MKDPTHAIFVKSRVFKDIKNDNRFGSADPTTTDPDPVTMDSDPTTMDPMTMDRDPTTVDLDPTTTDLCKLPDLST